jgi:hypothetical protein
MTEANDAASWQAFGKNKDMLRSDFDQHRQSCREAGSLLRSGVALNGAPLHKF